MPRPRGVDDHLAFGKRVGKAALQNGLLVRSDTHLVTLAPPLVIEERELDTMVTVLARSVREVLRQLGCGAA